MKRVLVYRSDVLPYSETFIREQIRSLKSWDAELVGRRRSQKAVALNGVAVRIFDEKEFSRWERLKNGLKYFLLSPRSRELQGLREEEFDLVHAHFGTEAVDAYPLARSLGVPLLVTLHGYDITIKRSWWRSGRGGQKMRAYPDLLRFIAKQPSVSFIAVSDAIKRKAIDYGVPQEKIKVVYIGIDVDRFECGSSCAADRQNSILFVGRLVEKKGCRYLVEAFRDVKSRFKDARLRIVGDGPERDLLEAAVDDIRSSVDFLGACDPSVVAEEMRKAKVLCLPSVTAENGDAEGFGLVLLEAQACGLPVVTSALGGALEGVLHGETGYAFEEADVTSMAFYLEKVLSDDALFSALSKRARSFVEEKFSLYECSKSLEKTYDSAKAGL